LSHRNEILKKLVFTASCLVLSFKINPASSLLYLWLDRLGRLKGHFAISVFHDPNLANYES